ncbi:hypothetical protein GCM10022253_27790 [Sphingomonas endophytica]|uniref:Uncharacterized protein n=1 Tax=Sphingomonas endophytica TaxID=869719 RepID=A0A7X0MN72_9SPHN|nr:hypothetical protein [Sphingomonas endophytica]MBB5727081.1 hypothetical protein [Sphingomonas endophytica]MBB6503223.1 hypothetical protein [Sphingomonas endophytica]
MSNALKEWWAPLGLLLAALTPVGTFVVGTGDMRGDLKTHEQRMNQTDRRIDQVEQQGKEMQIDLRDQGRQSARMEAKLDLLLQRLPDRH